MKYFLDTNIIIYAIKGQYPSIREHFKHIAAQSIVIPTIVEAEIEYGARKSNNYDITISKYRQFMNTFIKVAFSEQAAVCYGQIRSDLEKRGEPIGRNDLIIASIVLADNGILVTNNEKEFNRIEGLRLENWTI
ncbi:MAG: type II toxin-antitoxin system VapC family toxin [Lachnospiraceae bacterium]|nr:type II toxin-antitoxin system VapC family toxin [Lachnospiraceae bacterium]